MAQGVFGSRVLQMFLYLSDRLKCPYSVPFGPINNIEQTFAHPQAVARGITVEVEVRNPPSYLDKLLIVFIQHPRAGKIKLVAPAVTYNGKRMPVTRPPPYLSQHTSEVSHAISLVASLM